MIRPYIVLARLKSGELRVAYLGDDAAKADKTYAELEGNTAEVEELAFFHRARPQRSTYPTSSATINALSLAAQRDPEKERRAAAVVEEEKKILEEAQPHIREEARRRVHKRETAAAVGSSLDKTVRDAADTLPDVEERETSEENARTQDSESLALDGGDDAASHFGGRRRRTRATPKATEEPPATG